MEIGPRDIVIMEFLFEQRVATREQLGKRFFMGRSQPTVHERLEKLFLAGYLTKDSERLGRNWVAVYGLEEKALELIASTYRYPITNPICKSDSMIHDLHLVDLRERLEQTKMLVNYVSENVLQACSDFQDSKEFRPFYQINSDAVVVLNTKAGRFHAALEYEGSVKSNARYVKKLRDYYLAQQVEAVFYICGNASIERAIRQAEIEVAPDFDPKIFTCPEEIVQRGVLPLPFTHRENGKFSMC